MGFDVAPYVVIGAVLALFLFAYAPMRLRAAARRGRRPGALMHRDAGAATMGAGMAGIYAASHRDEDPTHGGDVEPVDSGHHGHGLHGYGGGYGDGDGGLGGGDGGGGGGD